MSSASEKLSVSVPKGIVASLRRRVGPGGVSGFIAKAIEHELEREQLQDLLGELKAQHGAISEAVLDEARAAWPKP